MDKIINYLLLTIIFVFDPLAISLVIAANFAFEKLRKPTKENLYGEIVEAKENLVFKDAIASPISDTEDFLEEEIESEPAVEFDDESQTLSENEIKIIELEKKANEIKNRPLYKRAHDNFTSEIKKLKDEDNTITY